MHIVFRRRRHEADRLEQEAQSELERQRIEGDTLAEVARHKLIEEQMKLRILETTGVAKAEASSKTAASKVECTEHIKQAESNAEALKKESVSSEHRGCLHRKPLMTHRYKLFLGRSL